MVSAGKNPYLKIQLARGQMVGAPVRFFGAAHHDHHEQPGKESGRKTGNPGWYNKRFEPSQGNDGNYFDF